MEFHWNCVRRYQRKMLIVANDERRKCRYRCVRIGFWCVRPKWTNAKKKTEIPRHCFNFGRTSGQLNVQIFTFDLISTCIPHSLHLLACVLQSVNVSRSSYLCDAFSMWNFGAIISTGQHDSHVTCWPTFHRRMDWIFGRKCVWCRIKVFARRLNKKFSERTSERKRESQAY